MTSLDILKAADEFYDAALSIQTAQENLETALRAIDAGYEAIARLKAEKAAEPKPEPKEDPLCGICMNPKSAHTPEGGFVPLNDPNFYDTSADTRENVVFDAERYDFDEFYEILGFGSLNDRDKGWKGEENA